MNDRTSQIRNRIREHRHDSSANALRYPARLRKDILVHMREQQSQGRGITAVARAIGINANTLYKWSKESQTRGELRPVVTRSAQTEKPQAARPPERFTVTSPQGFRIEGLDFADLARLLRELS